MTDPFGSGLDPRPARNRWAPGNYICTCSGCNKRFQGEKRATQCAPCAYAIDEVKTKRNDNYSLLSSALEDLALSRQRVFGVAFDDLNAQQGQALQLWLSALMIEAQFITDYIYPGMSERIIRAAVEDVIKQQKAKKA